MFSRNVLTRRGRGFRGNFPSRKLGRMVAGESLVELLAILLWEFSPGVLTYREQPTVIQYVDGEITRDYYPDFEIVLTTGEVIHLEIKTAKEMAKPVSQSKYRAIATAYARRQHGFRLLTDEDMGQGYLSQNLEKLASLIHFRPDGVSRAKWFQHFGNGPVPFATVADKLGENEVLRLIAWREAHGDLNEPLMGDLKVQLIGEGGCDATYLL